MANVDDTLRRKANAEKARRWRANNPEKARASDKRSNAMRDPEKERLRQRMLKEIDPGRIRESNRKATEKRRASGAKAADARAWYEKNKDAVKAATKARSIRLRAELRPQNAERMRRRSARKILATPLWADVFAMRRLYEEAARKTVETGFPHQVDHIVPLVSRMVCGLHTQHNLAVITKNENQEKSNRFWPDMWPREVRQEARRLLQDTQ